MKNEKMQRAYMDAILRLNEHINLTAIRDRDEFWSKHILDSLACEGLPELERASAVADVGTGGGFPGVPLAINFPEKQFTLIDSTAKKLRAVQCAVDELGLANVVTLNGRAEELGGSEQYRERFDLVVSRAVAELNILCEWCLPLVRVGGAFIAYKGARAAEELKAADSAIAKLGGKLDRVETVALPEAEEHSLIIITKVSVTPSLYPRNAGASRKKPL